MKRFLATGLMIAVFAVTPLVAGAPQPDETIKFETMPRAGYTVLFNDISVPGEVIMYAQLKYQGHAVTKVEKIKKNNADAFRLRVDRDDQGTEGFYLIFDNAWKLMGEEKISAPAAPAVKPEKKEQKQEPETAATPVPEKPRETPKPEEKPTPPAETAPAEPTTPDTE